MSPEQSRYQIIQEVAGIDGFWDQIGNAEHVALLLDYDGTLAPFHVDRLKAVPLEGVVDALKELRDTTDTDLALVSGRPISEILQLMPDPGVTIIGTHGFELRRPGEEVSNVAISPDQSRILDRAFIDARKLIGEHRVERKVATVAAHFRGLDRLDTLQYEHDLLERWLTYVDTDILEVRKFKGGLEMRALGRHKGVAVADYLDACPNSTVAVYVGDDDTDEDAFRTVINRGGHGVRVGTDIDETAAAGSLASCDAVLQFLRTWIEVRRIS
jgi:trehalose 6-phosphate phosphatase